MWWVYLADRKRNTMVLPPEKVLGLVDTKEVRSSLHNQFWDYPDAAPFDFNSRTVIFGFSLLEDEHPIFSPLP